MTKSWWGWGNVENAVTGAEREALTGRVKALLPDSDLTVHEPPALEPGSFSAARVELPSSLAALGSVDLADRVAHSHGQAFRDVVRCLLGRIDSLVDVVVRPGSEQDVVDVLDWCSAQNVAVIPFGGGTSVVGGVEPAISRPTRA